MTDYTALLADLADLQARVVLDGRHRYKVDGKYGPPGVTTCIKSMAAPALVRWMVRQERTGTARTAFHNRPLDNEPQDAYIERLGRLADVEMEHERVSKAAAEVGTQVHAYIQFEIEKMLGRNPEAPAIGEDALYRVAGWNRWAKDAGLKPLATESRLYNARHDYAGTADIIALVEGHLSVLDIKTTEKIYCERRLQLIAYREALPGNPDSKGYINVLHRDGGDITAVEVDATQEECEASWRAFLACLELHRYQAQHDKQTRKAS